MENLAEDICSFVPTHVCGLVTLLGTAAPAFLTVQIQSQPGLSWVMSSHTVWLYGFLLLIFSCLCPYNVFSVDFGMQYGRAKYVSIVSSCCTETIKSVSPTAAWLKWTLSFIGVTDKIDLICVIWPTDNVQFFPLVQREVALIMLCSSSQKLYFSSFRTDKNWCFSSSDEHSSWQM